MEVELLVNIIILSTVGFLCIIVIAVRIYVGCCRDSHQLDYLPDQAEIIAPQIEVKQQDFIWMTCQQPITRNQQCSICLDRRVDTLTSCNHMFHMNCLIQWKKRMKNLCPYCKSQGLSNITFYCQACRKQKCQYHFSQPLIYQRNHMVPNYFIEFLTNKKRLLCIQCRENQVQSNVQCITRNFESIKGSRSKEDLISNKISRNRQPVDIEIKTPKQSRQKLQTGSTEGTPHQLASPLTQDRFLIAIDY